MTKKDQQLKDHLEDLLVKAIQSGKKETSGLAGDLKTGLKVLDQKMTDYIDNDNKWKKEQGIYIKENTEFRLQTTGGMSTLKWLAGSGLGLVVCVDLNDNGDYISATYNGVAMTK